MKRLLFTAPLALALATPAFAHPGGPVDADRVLERADRVLDEVDATEAQRDSFEAVVRDTLPQLKAYHEEAGELREDIRTIFRAETVDRVALEVARGDLLDLVDRVSATAFDALADLAEIFSPEQRETLRERREARRHAMARRLGLID